MTKKAKPLYLPSLRANMGDWIYYVCYMRMRDIANRISIAQEIHTGEGLKNLIQRELTGRASAIADYLCDEKQRFFNAIVAGVYGGKPDWYELEIGGNVHLPAKELPDYLKNGMGVLRLDGSEKLFAIDGQHRAVGIREALDRDTDCLQDEEVCVIFVGHKRTKAGKERTRRLFTTLNRYAKPVSLSEIIALDEDDVAAIVTRDVLEAQGLMNQARVSITKSRSLPPSDNRNITNITALYKSHDLYLRGSMGPSTWRDFKRRRPCDEDLSVFRNTAMELWKSMAKSIGAFRQVLKFRKDKPIGKLRDRNGGHLLFRPVGLPACVEAISLAVHREGLSLAEATKRLSKIPMNLQRKPWAGLLWNTHDRTMISGKDRKPTARDLLLYMMGCKFWSGTVARKTATVNLLNRYAAAQNKEASAVDLPAPIVKAK